MIRDMLSPNMPGALSQALAERSDIFDMVDQAERAVLRPEAPGGVAVDLRHALAARIAHMGGQADLAARYGDGLAGDLAAIAQGAPSDSPMVRFMDQVAVATADVTAADVAALTEAGVAEPDVVRLCELNAFVSFQLRVLAALRLMESQS